MKGGRLGPKNRFFRPVVRASSSGECDAPGEDGVWTDQNRSVETALVSPTIASLRGYATTASLRGYVSLSSHKPLVWKATKSARNDEGESPEETHGRAFFPWRHWGRSGKPGQVPRKVIPGLPQSVSSTVIYLDPPRGVQWTTPHYL